MDDADLVATRPGAAPAADGFTPHDRYVLIERLGEGGMGTVWAAHDKVLDRNVALKVLHDEFLGAEDQARLVAEARAMARLSHRNVVDVYDVAEKDGRTYLTMELVRGIDLGAWLETPRDWTAIVAIFRAAAAGLAAAHAAGIVHRDVKPANILVGDDGETRVADFGVAHASASRPDPDAPLTAVTAGQIGTLAYMSPAQLRGEPADARCDQFALFSSLYEALHGTRPFRGENVAEQLLAIERGCPPPVRDVPRWLHATVERGLANDPEQRFATMNDVVTALAGPRRRRGWLIAAALLVVGGGAITATLLARSSPAGATCPDPKRELAGVWDASVSQRGEAAFAATTPAYVGAVWSRIARELDRRATEWSTASNEACLANDAPRRACLAEYRALLGALGARLAVTPAMAQRADALFVALPSLTDCAEPAYRPAVSLATSAAIDAARADHALARAGLVIGATPEDLAAAARALAAARTAGDPALELATSLTHARLQLALATPEIAGAELSSVAKRAAEQDARVVEVDAELALARTLIARGRLDEADAAVSHALVITSAVNHPRRAVTGYEIAAEVARRRGDEPGALTYLEEGVRMAKLAHLDDTPWALPLFDATTRAYLRAGRVDDGLAASKRVIDLSRQLGEHHPVYGRALLLGASANLAFRRIDKAKAKVTGALRIFRDAFGEDNVDVTAAQTLLAEIAAAEGRSGEASAGPVPN